MFTIEYCASSSLVSLVVSVRKNCVLFSFVPCFYFSKSSLIYIDIYRHTNYFNCLLFGVSVFDELRWEFLKKTPLFIISPGI